MDLKRLKQRTEALFGFFQRQNAHPDDSKHVPVEDYLRLPFEKGMAIADLLTNGLNGGDQKSLMLGLLYGLSRSHNHLQGVTVWTLLEVLGRLPFHTGSDARNEHALKACGKVRETLSENIYWESV